MIFAKRAVVLVSCLSLAACSSIGSINGVDLNGPRMGVTDQGSQPYCNQNDQQRWTCILAAVAIVGGFAAIALSNRGSSPAAGGGGGEESGGT